MSELWIPITGMICITVGLIVYLVVTARHKKQVQITLQQHLENGGVLTTALLEQFGAVPNSRQSDLRKGLVFSFLGLACLFAGWIGSAFKLGAILGVFPLFLGIAFFIIAYLNNDE